MEEIDLSSPSEKESESKNLPKEGIISKVIKNITIEPLVICWLLPFLLTYAAIENMNVEKACRGQVTESTGFSKNICKLIVRKDSFNILCDGSTNSTNFAAIEEKFPQIYDSIKNNLTNAINFICEAEEPVQAKLSYINSIRNPTSAIGPLVIILFAGPWSDKKNLRIPCMMVPLLGEAIGYLSLFVSAIFIDGPVELPAYAYRLIPSLTGAENLMVMAIFSYLSACSTEENRTFRFGMYQILMTIVPIFAQSLSPTLNNNFEYAELFGMMIPLHIIGLIYGIFFLMEVKSEDSKENAAYDNPAASTMEISNPTNNLENIEESAKSPKNFCIEFFDPRLAKQCIKSFYKKRENRARPIIIIMLLMHFVVHGMINGESQNIFLYQRVKLGWDIDTHSYHNVFMIISNLIGTLVMIGLLSKVLKFSDIVLALISTGLSFISRIVYTSVQTTVGFFTGSAIDFTSTVKFLAARAIISKQVPQADLSTMFALMGLFEAFAGIVFPYIYPTFYQYLIHEKRDVGEFFYLSIGLLLIVYNCYLFVLKLLRAKDRKEAENAEKVESTKL